MKCPNCKNEINITRTFKKGIAAKPNVKWYQYTNMKYRGFGIEIMPENPNAKWYQFTKTKVLCDNCSAELKVHSTMTNLRIMATVWLLTIPLSDLLFPELFKNHLGVKLLLFFPSIIMMMIAHKMTEYTVELAAEKPK